MKVLIADDHLLFRQGLQHLLRSLAEAVTVVEAGTRAQTLEQVQEHADLELVFLDLVMPGTQGLELLQTLTRDFATLPVIVLSASTRTSDMRDVLDNGALGFVPKSASAEVMLSAAKLVLAGGVYVPPELLNPGVHALEPDLMGALTQRQRQVLRGIVDGKPNKVISGELNVSEATVKAHVTAVLRTLKVTNRTQAAITGRRLFANH